MVTDKKTPQAAETAPKQESKPDVKAAANKPGAADTATAKKTAAKQKSGKSATTAAKKGFPWIKTLLLLILIGALAGAGWLGWTEWQTQIESRAGISDSLQDDMAELEGKLQKQQQLTRQVVQQQSQLIGQLEDQLYSVKLRLNSQAERILQLGTASRGDWMLSEAAYLIRLANQRLQVERSTENPLAILENVDNIFVQLNDPELIPVRRALAEDIAALRMTGKIDREGIFLELEAISEAIKQLSITEPASQTEAAKPVAVENTQMPSLLDSFERFSQKLGQLIVVQKRQQPIEPLLTSSEQSIIQNNIYLLLEQAQSALLKEEQVIYRASLEKTAALLARYFQLNSQSQALIERLNLLGERPVIQGLPDISGSVAAVQTMLTLRQSRISDGEQEK
jgi:uroporphyrin-III C-methyltransferase